MSIPEDPPRASTEKYYSSLEVAKLWRLSVKRVQALFANEEGVLVSEETAKGRMSRRRERIVRIPRSVLERVYARLRVPGEPPPDPHSAAAPDAPAAPVLPERYFSLQEIAEMWSISVNRVRRLFKNEEGVTRFYESPKGSIVRRRVVRVPQHIVERVHSRIHGANG
jgi:hypothetical protein